MNATPNPDKSYTIVTGYKGIPAKIIANTGLYAQEIYPPKSDVNLTLKEADALRKKQESIPLFDLLNL